MIHTNLITYLAVVAEANGSGRAYQAKLDMVNHYMHHNRLPAGVRAQIRTFFELRYPAKKAFDETNILTEVSVPLKEAICMHNCQTVLKALQVLDNAEPGLPGAISQCLERVVFVSGDTIVREGEVTDGMYFLLRGHVDVIHLAVSKTPITTLGPQSFFGEVAMLSKRHRAITSVVVCLDHCEGYRLTVSAFNHLTHGFPSFRAWLESVARLRLAEACGTKTFLTPTTSLKKRSGKSAVGHDLQLLIDANDENLDEEATERLASAIKEKKAKAKRASFIPAMITAALPASEKKGLGLGRFRKAIANIQVRSTQSVQVAPSAMRSRDDPLPTPTQPRPNELGEATGAWTAVTPCDAPSRSDLLLLDVTSSVQ